MAVDFTGLTCSKAPGFRMVEHQLVTNNLLVYSMNQETIYVYWVTDHMLPYKASYVYCQRLSAANKYFVQN